MIVSAPFPEDTRLLKRTRVLKVEFDDGHDSGFYIWPCLCEPGRDRATRGREYRERVQAQPESPVMARTYDG